jgi:phosphoribosylformylglycinamidine synthase I
MRFGIVVFPGTWSDTDCYHQVVNVLGQQAGYVWHQETALEKWDCVILPGGFSYGDYLRAGAMASLSPVMEAVHRFAKAGRPVIGICNGFQVLCESGLLPGALLRNNHLQYRCQWTHLLAERAARPFTSRCQPGQVLQVPVSHGEGNYFADPETLARLEGDGRILFRYCEADGAVTPAANPNGSIDNIAGIINQAGNVLGMMPHPERSCEELLGSADGNLIFRSIIESCADGSSGIVINDHGAG